MIKNCSVCKIDKDISEFSKIKKTGNHLGTCKACRAKYMKKYYKKNREKLKEYSNKYYHNHKKERQEYIEMKKKEMKQVKIKIEKENKCIFARVFDFFGSFIKCKHKDKV